MDLPRTLSRNGFSRDRDVVRGAERGDKIAEAVAKILRRNADDADYPKLATVLGKLIRSSVFANYTTQRTS